MAGLLDFADNGLPGSQSSIASLLQTLMAPPPQQTPPGMPQGPSGGPVNIGGISMPGPQAAPQPTIAPPPKPPGLVDRIKGHLSGLLDMNAPQGYDSLLSPDEIAQAKPSLLSRIIGGPDALSPTHQYQENLNHIIGIHQIAAQVTEARRQMAAKQEMATRFPQPQPSGDPEKDRQNLQQWMSQMYGFAMSHGLDDIGKEFGNSLRGIMSAPRPETSKVVNDGGALVDSNGKVLYTAPALTKAPVLGSPEWRAAEDFKASLAAKYRVEPTQLIQGADAQGAMHWYRVPKSGGPPEMLDGITAGKPGAGAGMGNLPAPMAAKVGQFGEMLKKSSDLLPAMDALEMRLGSSTAQDVAAGKGALGHIPGASSIGSMMLSKTPEAATYQAALNPFILAAAHALSGARINPEQVKQIRASIELTPGMSPQERAQKRKNLVDLVNSIGGSLPATAVAGQEDQMEPKSMGVLRGYGYRGAARQGAPSASPASGGKRAISADQAAFLKTVKGMSDAAIAAQYTVRP